MLQSCTPEWSTLMPMLATQHVVRFNLTFYSHSVVQSFMLLIKKLSLKYWNSATELLSDSVAQLVRAWQAICQVAGSSPSLSHCLSPPPPPFFLVFISHISFSLSVTWVRSDCQVWSMFKIWAFMRLALPACRTPPPSPPPSNIHTHNPESVNSNILFLFTGLTWQLLSVVQWCSF